MNKKWLRIRIGLRTVKTAVAVIVAMLIVEALGTTDSKLIFAMLGAMAAVQPTFRDSVESCLTQIVGVLFGAVAGVLLRFLPGPDLVAVGIGIILVITLYNTLRIRYSPSLPCFVVVMLCTTPDIQPMAYAIGRIWDTAIGLAVGMIINTLLFPYDNSRRIRATAESLDKVLIQFLEDLFDGDESLPQANEMRRTIDSMDRELQLFANQKLILRLRRQKQELEVFRECEDKARELVARMEVLSQMGRPGRLNGENRRRLLACGADIRDERPLDSVLERDVVTNYHVSQILKLRRELLEVLKQ
ncbi:MAG: FUSC family protein [Oscillospiraceae bacterium]|nr:FUSC family protein [Oscillospiraceae bacterium]